MWRSILLGKMSLSILASLVVGIVCLTVPWRQSLSTSALMQWLGMGVFFVLLAVGQIGVVWFLRYRR